MGSVFRLDELVAKEDSPLAPTQAAVGGLKVSDDELDGVIATDAPAAEADEQAVVPFGSFKFVDTEFPSSIGSCVLTVKHIKKKKGGGFFKAEALLESEDARFDGLEIREMNVFIGRDSISVSLPKNDWGTFVSGGIADMMLASAEAAVNAVVKGKFLPAGSRPKSGFALELSEPFGPDERSELRKLMDKANKALDDFEYTFVKKFGKCWDDERAEKVAQMMRSAAMFVFMDQPEVKAVTPAKEGGETVG